MDDSSPSRDEKQRHLNFSEISYMEFVENYK
jgi:hypothetical protein